MESRALDWLFDALEGYSFIDFILLIALIVIVTFGIRKAWPCFKRAIEMGEAAADLPEIKKAVELLPDMKKQLDRVHHEVFPNSGKSLRDELDRNSLITKNIDQKVNSLVEKVEPITGEIQVVRADLENHLKEVEGVSETVQQIKETLDG